MTPEETPMSEQSDDEVGLEVGHFEVDPARAMAAIIGFFVVVLAVVISFAWFAVANNRTDADVQERIVEACAGREYPTPPTCVEQIREAL